MMRCVGLSIGTQHHLPQYLGFIENDADALIRGSKARDACYIISRTSREGH